MMKDGVSDSSEHFYFYSPDGDTVTQLLQPRQPLPLPLRRVLVTSVRWERPSNFLYKRRNMIVSFAELRL